MMKWMGEDRVMSCGGWVLAYLDVMEDFLEQTKV